MPDFQGRTAATPANVSSAARQLACYTQFLRWAANFPRDELIRHPRHDQVLMLSPLQSGRFSFALQGTTLHLGIQPFEAVWMAHMPFGAAYVSDRLYLVVDAAACMNARLPPLVIGLFIDEPRKRDLMGQASRVQLTRVQVEDGAVAQLQGACGDAFELKPGDVIEYLSVQHRETNRFL